MARVSAWPCKYSCEPKQLHGASNVAVDDGYRAFLMHIIGHDSAAQDSPGRLEAVEKAIRSLQSCKHYCGIGLYYAEYDAWSACEWVMKHKVVALSKHYE